MAIQQELSTWKHWAFRKRVGTGGGGGAERRRFQSQKKRVKWWEWKIGEVMNPVMLISIYDVKW